MEPSSNLTLYYRYYTYYITVPLIHLLPEVGAILTIYPSSNFDNNFVP